MQQVVENLDSAAKSSVGNLTAEDLEIVAKARKVYSSLDVVHCTECRYCMPCPNGVDIPLNFLMFNRGVGLGQLGGMRFRYRGADHAMVASACIGCRLCEEKCPQQILIADWMPIVDDVLGKGADFNPRLAPTGE
jgi:predicted aldo/keto reductase-like oxidoreductase